jgi:hypothetical protein
MIDADRVTDRFGPNAIILPPNADFPCQRHVNERTSFFDCDSRWLQANVSEFQERKFVYSKACRLCR